MLKDFKRLQGEQSGPLIGGASFAGKQNYSNGSLAEWQQTSKEAPARNVTPADNWSSVPATVAQSHGSTFLNPMDGIQLSKGKKKMIAHITPQLASEVRTKYLAFIEKEGVKANPPASPSRKVVVSTGGDLRKGLAGRITVFLYGLVCYAAFFGTFLYAAGFIGNLFVPKSIDSEPRDPLPQALLINLLLLGIFAIQHSLMARPFFKQRWTRIVPSQVERSTYVLLSSLALILMFWQWRPMGGVVWDVQDSVGKGFLLSLFAFGWLLVLVTTFLINHFDLFGLRQVTLYLMGKEYTPLQFRTPGLYKLVRHPLYVGWLFAFWATPTMTITHLVFALATTAYILIAVRWEERDLVDKHGRAYETYQRSVPMLIPTGRKKDTVREALG